MGVADVVECDADGDLFVRLVNSGADSPTIRLAPGRDEVVAGAPGLGDRLLVRFELTESGKREARLIKRLGQSAHRILGVVRRTMHETRVDPVDRRSREGLVLPLNATRTLCDGDLVVASIDGPSRRPHGPKPGRVIEVVGRQDQPGAFSLIAIHTHGVPTGFADAAVAEADAARAPELARPNGPARRAPDYD